MLTQTSFALQDVFITFLVFYIIVNVFCHEKMCNCKASNYVLLCYTEQICVLVQEHVSGLS